MVPSVHTCRGHRCADPAEIAPIQQVGIAILAQSHDQGGRRGARDIDEDGTGPAEIGIATVERRPIDRRPVIGGRTAEDTGPGWRRMTASLPLHVTPPPPLPVVTNVLVPSLAMPPGPHIPALVDVVAKDITLAGLFIWTPTTRP